MVEQPRRILVVDDDPTVRQICMRVLRSAGYDTYEASDGAAAYRVPFVCGWPAAPAGSSFRTQPETRGDSERLVWRNPQARLKSIYG
jgi:hypothetical protein